MVDAVAAQVRDHFAPAWRIQASTVAYLGKEASRPASGAVLTVADDPTQPGLLGWHTEGAQDVIYGYVFAAPVLDNGGAPLTGATYTVAATLSHEVLETIADPHVNLWVTGPGGTLVSQEVCDPVENHSYEINGVSVSNFVTPNWFDAHAAPGTPMDYLGRVSQPFQMDQGGYCVRMQGGQPTQIHGSEMPRWRRDTKLHPHSRAGHLTKLGTLSRSGSGSQEENYDHRKEAGKTMAWKVAVTITDSRSGSPVAGVPITDPSKNALATTDASGVANITLGSEVLVLGVGISPAQGTGSGMTIAADTLL